MVEALFCAPGGVAGVVVAAGPKKDRRKTTNDTNENECHEYGSYLRQEVVFVSFVFIRVIRGILTVPSDYLCPCPPS